MKSHLAPEIIFGYEHGLLSPAEVQSVHEHVAACEACRNRLAAAVDVEGMVSALRDEVGAAPRRGRPLVYAAAAAVILAAALTGWLALRPRNLPPVLADRIEVPAFIEELNPPRQTLMGEAVAARADRMTPRGTAVLSARPSFKWPAQPGSGWMYRVQVFSSGPEPVVESPETPGLEWTPDRDLASGMNYQWQVTAVRGDDRATLPGPPDTPPRFRVLDRDTAVRITRLVNQGLPRLELALAYSRAGLVDDARRELDAAIQERPADGKLRRLREELPR